MLGVYATNTITLDLAFTITFVTHSGHFCLKKVKLDCSSPPLEHQGLT